MRLKYLSIVLIAGLLVSTAAESQTIMVRPGGRYYRPRRMVRPVPSNMRRQLPYFQPTVRITYLNIAMLTKVISHKPVL
jgi:hypothetical protein